MAHAADSGADMSIQLIEGFLPLTAAILKENGKNDT
jgi:hypothetical protein